MKRKPFMLKPASQDYLWGGSRLNDDFNLGLPVSPLAEAWMCSTHPDGVSTLSSGELLSDVLQMHPEWLGSHPLTITDGKPELPILIKLIDAKSDLSVQVHPDDEYAREYEGQWGKVRDAMSLWAERGRAGRMGGGGLRRTEAGSQGRRPRPRDGAHGLGIEPTAQGWSPRPRD